MSLGDILNQAISGGPGSHSKDEMRAIAETMVDEIRMRSFHFAMEDIKAWADKAFPTRTDQGMYLKLYSEIAEMIDAKPDNLEGEVADVFIMLLDFAARRNINLPAALAKKMAINRGRKWAENHLGAWSHVK